jgi:hypothetical protein
MSRYGACPCCKQPLPTEVHEGVYLPPTKSAIYRIIKDNPDITIEGIMTFIDLSHNVIRQHIYQINVIMASAGVHVIGNSPGRKGRYSIVRAEIAA